MKRIKTFSNIGVARQKFQCHSSGQFREAIPTATLPVQERLLKNMLSVPLREIKIKYQMAKVRNASTRQPANRTEQDKAVAAAVPQQFLRLFTSYIHTQHRDCRCGKMITSAASSLRVARRRTCFPTHPSPPPSWTWTLLPLSG